MECGYCLYFYQGKRRRQKRDGRLIYHRFCIPKDDWVGRGDIWCEKDFEFAPLFYCDQWQVFVSAKVCDFRQTRSKKPYYRDCRHCGQGEDVRYTHAIKGLSIDGKPTPPKKQLVKRKKPQLIKRKKPQLIKRKKPQLIKRIKK